MAKMNAARWYGAKDVCIEEVDVPEVQSHQVKKKHLHIPEKEKPN